MSDSVHMLNSLTILIVTYDRQAGIIPTSKAAKMSVKRALTKFRNKGEYRDSRY